MIYCCTWSQISGSRERDEGGQVVEKDFMTVYQLPIMSRFAEEKNERLGPFLNVSVASHQSYFEDLR